MHDEARDAVIGRTVRDFQEARRRVAELRASLRQRGEVLQAAGAALQVTQTLVDAGSGVFRVDHLDRVTSAPAAAFDVVTLTAQITELRQTDARLERLVREMRELGLSGE